MERSLCDLEFVGKALAEGHTLEVAEATLGQVAEGVNTLRLVYEKCLEDVVAMPILSALYECHIRGQARPPDRTPDDASGPHLGCGVPNAGC